MSLRLLLILSVLVGGCATSRADIPPGCDGRERRPANPHGSVLIASPSETPVPGDPVMASGGGCT